MDVGHSWESQTSAVTGYEFSMLNGVRVTLIDTPGLDDNTEKGCKSVAEMCIEIYKYLSPK